jgi:hypothetical protein
VIKSSYIKRVGDDTATKDYVFLIYQTLHTFSVAVKSC